MIDLSGDDGICVHPRTTDNRRGFGFPQVTGDIAGCTHDDIRLREIRNKEEKIWVKIASFSGAEFHIANSIWFQYRQFLIELLGSNRRLVNSEIVSGLTTRSYRRLPNHSQRHLAVAGIIFCSNIEVITGFLGIFDILAIGQFFPRRNGARPVFQSDISPPHRGRATPAFSGEHSPYHSA